jgi:beta-lactam-binding protein with PASTA domain
LFFASLGFLLFLGLVSTAVFFLSVQGHEQVLVPDVMRKDLVAALLELQTKELYPRIQLRYSNIAAEKGMVLEQDPRAGAIVKAGRRIRLVVSQGQRLSVMENFAGRTLSEVRAEIAQAAGSDAFVTLKEPVLYKTSSAPSGTVLAQSPEAGTAISGPVAVTLVVSSGPETGLKEMPVLIGLSPGAAAARLSEREINFVFTMLPARNNEKPFVVNAQDWPAGTQISAEHTVEVQVASPASRDAGEVCALYSYKVPQTPVPIRYTLAAISPQGERTELLAASLSRGAFTCPYLLPAGTALSLVVQGRELHREIVAAL